MKVLITGGQGYVGGWLTERFCSLGHEVHVLGRSAEKIIDLPYSLIQADISDHSELQDKISEYYDLCVHAAGCYNEDLEGDLMVEALKINTYGTSNILSVMADKGVGRFVYLSTFHVYGKSAGVIAEDVVPEPSNEYALTHFLAEQCVEHYAAEKAMDSIVLRLSNCYGAPRSFESGRWSLVINDLIKSAYETGEIVLKSNGKGVRDFVWLGDVCDVAEKLIAVDIGRYSLFNVASGVSTSIINVAEMIQACFKEQFGRDVTIEVNVDDKTLANDGLVVDCSKLRSAIDFAPCDRMKEEIIDTVKLLEEDKSVARESRGSREPRVGSRMG